MPIARGSFTRKAAVNFHFSFASLARESSLHAFSPCSIGFTRYNVRSNGEIRQYLVGITRVVSGYHEGDD